MATQSVENATAENVAIARAAYEAYVTKDRTAIERLIAEDFHFTSPLDNRLDRQTYFRRCWPNSKEIEGFDFIRFVTDADRVFVTYEGRNTNGHRFRNTEILTIRDQHIVDVEVYFGWSLPHKAPQGGFVDDAPPRDAAHHRDVGLRERLDRAIDRALDDRRIVGTVVLVAEGGDVLYSRAAGLADREAGRSMEEDGIFLLASVAKPIVTAAALRLVEDGRMSLGDSVRRWLPEFAPRLPDGRVPDITLQQLLTHSAGLTYVFMEPDDGPYHRLRISNGFDRTDADLDEIVRRISAAPLSYQPGAGWGYSMAMDVLGAVIEKVTLQPLPQAVAELVLHPLDMRDTAFAVVDPRRLVAHYADAKPEPRRLSDDDHVDFLGNQVAFSPVRLLDPKAFPSGGAGLAGTASDVLTFLDTLRAGGLLQPQTRAAMFKVQALTRGQAEGPGWEFGFGGAVLVDPKAAGTPQAPGTLQWNGAYGHKWFVDPANELTVVALTNTAFEGMIGRFTVDVRNAVYGV